MKGGHMKKIFYRAIKGSKRIFEITKKILRNMLKRRNYILEKGEVMSKIDLKRGYF